LQCGVRELSLSILNEKLRILAAFGEVFVRVGSD
jgi:hypothetical protein